MKEKKYNKILIDEFKRTFPIYILGMIFHAITTYILYLIPGFIANILDLLLSGNSDKILIMEQVYKIIFYSVILIIPRIIYRTLFFTVARTSDTKLRKEVIKHLQEVKPIYYEQEDKGAYLAYLSKEILNIREFLGNNFFNISRLIISPIIGLIVIGKNLNIILSLSVLPILILSILEIVRLYKKEKEAIERARKAYVQLSNTIEQNTSGFSLIKLYNQQENQIEKFKNVNEQIYLADYNIGVVKNKISNVINILYASCFSIGFSIGLILINRNLLTVGDLTTYISCISMAISGIVSSIEPLLNGIAYFKQSTNRYNYFFGLEKYKKDGIKLNDFEKMEIKNLSYSYDDKENYAIKNISMVINKGEKIGIVGQVGSGKTTLMNIISGFYEIEDNTIFINDIDMNKYSRDSIFKNIGYAMQKNVITDSTIKENININKDADNNQIKDVSKKANIYEDIKNMENGFDTKIGENGAKVSGGQKQRIQIARNLLNIRKINIFDDTLSALDIDTEKKVLNEIEKNIEDNTLIVISNKISMMEKMDKVYILIDGKIIDSGTHLELLRKNELYKQLSAYERAGDLV